MKLDFKGVSNYNSVYDSGQFAYSKAETRGKVLKWLQSMQTHAEILLIVPF